LFKKVKEDVRMKKSKEYTQIEKKRFVPEIKNCLACQRKLKRHMTLSKKKVITLNGAVSVTHIGYSCPSETCVERRKVYRSAAADALALPNFTFGMDVVALVGYLKMSSHYTVDEVHKEINKRLSIYGMQISRRNVMYLFEAYCALLKASAKNTSDPDFQAWMKQIREKKQCIISIDGIQPDKGEDTVYLIREVTTNRLLHAQNVSSSDKNTMKEILSSLFELNLPITGFISDAQQTIVSAIASLWPAVPHQTCQFHYFQEASRPIYDEDRAVITEMRQTMTDQLRPLRRQLAKELACTKSEETEESHHEREQMQIIDTYVVAAKSSLNRNGIRPFDYAGLKGYQDLDALEQSIENVKKKRRQVGERSLRMSNEN
jgi:hypothetical protein